tara:strand:- start:8725 stop:10047 length:1323 start_codon:yes stop_codon:yes gene_type:complete
MATAPPKLSPIQKTSPYVLKSTGSYNLVTATSVPYGVYLNGPLSSSQWTSGAVAQVALTYKMLGGDVLDIELTENNVYTAYEMATLEYSTIVNNHQAINVLSDFLGALTGTFSHSGTLEDGTALSSSLTTDGKRSHAALKFPKFKFEYSKRVANGLAGEAGFGDDSRIYSASISLINGQQNYDLQKIVQDASTDGSTMGQEFANNVDNKRISIRRVYYRSPQTMWRFYGYYGGLNVVGNLYTYGQYSDESTFEVVPAWQNKLQAMAFETNLYTRASHYSYEIHDNRIRLYPPVTSPGFGGPSKIWFDFTVPQDSWVEDSTRLDGMDGVNNYNTLPFANIPYPNINSMGKQWIRKYALAIAKGMLAQVRGKFGAIPIPGESVTLNASDLSTQAKEEKEKLRTELVELLDKLTYEALMTSDANLVENSNKIQVSIPMGIYRG